MFKNTAIRYETDEGAIRFISFCFFIFFGKYALVKFGHLHFSFTKGSHFKIITQSINRFCTHTIQAHRFLESFTIVLGTRIYFAYYVYYFTQWYSTSVVAHGDCSFVNNYFHAFAKAHGILIYAVVYHFLQQYIDAVVHAATVAQLAYIHAGTQTYMFTPVKRFNALFSILIQ